VGDAIRAPENRKARDIGVVHTATSNTPYGQTSTQSRFPSHRARSTTGRIVRRSAGAHDGNKNRAAELLWLNRTTVVEKLRRRETTNPRGLSVALRPLRRPDRERFSEIG
jgi:transcriptional regulator with PAS, ATPase and Fis domain